MDNKEKYSYFQHLRELRQKVIISLVFFIITFCLSYNYSETVLNILIKPLLSSAFPPKKIVYTNLVEAFISHMKLAFFCSLFISAPFILYQFYSFISPGLYYKEKKAIIPFFLVGIILFLISTCFTYYFVFPNAWNFFTAYQTKIGSIELELMPKIIDYINLCIQFILVFGFIFQLPLVLVIIAKMGILNSRSLIKFRKAFIVIAFILAAILTPPDIFSQIALAIPIVLLYEISIIVICYIEKGNNQNA